MRTPETSDSGPSETPEEILKRLVEKGLQSSVEKGFVSAQGARLYATGEATFDDILSPGARERHADIRKRQEEQRRMEDIQ